MRRIAFAFSEEGNGHRVRCEALADEMYSRGWDAPESVAASLAGADVLVVDTPRPLFHGNSKVVRIVDVPGQYDADLLVCGSAGVTPEMFTLSGADRVLAGPQYALLRPEFREARAVRSVLEVAGKAPSPNLVIDLRLVHGLSPQKIAANLIFASSVITYGGMRAMEAACVGASMIIVPRNEGERLNAFGLNSRDAAYYWVSCDLSEPNTAAAVDRLLSNEMQRSFMGLQARGLVDGLGCKRVADAIEEMFQ